MSYKHRELVGPSKSRTVFQRHFNPVAMMIVITIIISIVSWGAKARLTASADRNTPSPASQSSLVQSHQREHPPLPTNIQVQTFSLGQDGFEPKQINREPGPFVLGIDSRSQSASFEFVREDGRRAVEIKWPKGQIRWRKLVNLPPGNYLLKEINHPDWTAQITIDK